MSIALLFILLGKSQYIIEYATIWDKFYNKLYNSILYLRIALKNLIQRSNPRHNRVQSSGKVIKLLRSQKSTGLNL